MFCLLLFSVVVEVLGVALVPPVVVAVVLVFVLPSKRLSALWFRDVQDLPNFAYLDFVRMSSHFSVHLSYVLKHSLNVDYWYCIHRSFFS